MEKIGKNNIIIIKDRVEIYKDFALSLLYYINKYYIDRETLNNDVDIFNHFKWCYNKVCDEFKLEGLDFTTNNELIKYYYKYYYHQYYMVNNNQDNSLATYEKFWINIFDFNKQKNRNIINILIEIYNINDKSISINNDILKYI
jgi:hypothetical protein